MDPVSALSGAVSLAVAVSGLFSAVVNLRDFTLKIVNEGGIRGHHPLRLAVDYLDSLYKVAKDLRLCAAAFKARCSRTTIPRYLDQTIMDDVLDVAGYRYQFKIPVKLMLELLAFVPSSHHVSQTCQSIYPSTSPGLLFTTAIQVQRQLTGPTYSSLKT